MLFKEVIAMKIKGFGGVFWRTKDVDALVQWYKEVLGIVMGEWNGTIMQQQSGNETVFSFFTNENNYFPLEQSVMLNFQVEDMKACIEHLQQKGIPLLKEPEVSEYGTFIWISDPDGRWIELWEK